MFLVIKNMKIKMTLRDNLTPVWMSKFTNTVDCLYWRWCGVRGTLVYCWWEYKLVWQLLKPLWWFLRNVGINIPQDQTLPFFGIYPKDAQSYHKALKKISYTLNIQERVMRYDNTEQPSQKVFSAAIKRAWIIMSMVFFS